jgi:hypothetical protein
MRRLTSNLQSAGSFDTCQICGKTSDDICTFRLWQECDDRDQPEPGNYLLVGETCCRSKIHEHPRLYNEVPWGRGVPGGFVLVCGSCPFREGFHCTHPNLKSNGGDGLLVDFSNPLGGMTVHLNFGYNDPRTGMADFSVVSACEGSPTRPAYPEPEPEAVEPPVDSNEQEACPYCQCLKLVGSSCWNCEENHDKYGV